LLIPQDEAVKKKISVKEIVTVGPPQVLSIIDKILTRYLEGSLS
jgi:hypothetical protein